MEILWKWLSLCFGLFLVGLCNGFPINLEDTNAEHTQLLTGLVAVLLTVCSIVFLAGCLCCRRRNGFKEFRDSPVVVSVSSNLDHGHVNPIANGEFTIFTPLSPPHYNNNVFLANEQVITRTLDDYVYGDIDVSSWFDGPKKDFPRIKLKYIKELGKGWFGKVVEGAAQDLDPNRPWTPVVVRILDAAANARQRVLFLNDASIYLAAEHPNLLALKGRCVGAAPLLLLQEFCAGGDLKARLTTTGSEDKTLQWCCQLTSALRHLHEHGFVHPDLATRNCLLTDSLILKIGDYGLGPSKYPEDYYKGGEPLIPVRWRSPESLECTPTTIQPKKLTPEANVWTLGVVMWEICENAAQPYGDLDDDEVISRVFGTERIRLNRPSRSEMYTDYIYRLMLMCWNNTDTRPKVLQIDMMLSDLYQVYKNTQSPMPIENADFEMRWESLKPNTIVRTDNYSVNIDMEPDQSNISKPMSPSLNNLHGSLDNLMNAQPMESWLENVASEVKDATYVKGLSDAIKTLDTALDLENISTGSEQSFKPDFNIKTNIDFRLGPSVFSTNDKLPESPNQNDSLTDSMIFKQPGSSESETEEENWRKKVERGAYSEKVKLKSRSVADLMVLTHVDYSESESETPLPSLDYKSNRGGRKSNLETVSLNFSSEGNLLNVEDTFQEELRKLQVERRDSLLFVPDTRSQNNSNLSLLHELNSPIEIKPANQVFNIFNVSIDKFSPINGSKLNEIINIGEDTRSFSRQDSENKSDLGYATLHNSERNSDFGSVDGEHLLEDRMGYIKSEIEGRLKNCELFDKGDVEIVKSFEDILEEKMKIHPMQSDINLLLEDDVKQNVIDREESGVTYVENIGDLREIQGFQAENKQLVSSVGIIHDDLQTKIVNIKKNLPDIIASLDQEQNQNTVDLIESNSPQISTTNEYIDRKVVHYKDVEIEDVKKLCKIFIHNEKSRGNITILTKNTIPDSIKEFNLNGVSSDFDNKNILIPTADSKERTLNLKSTHREYVVDKILRPVPKLSHIIKSNSNLMSFIKNYDKQDKQTEAAKDSEVFFKESHTVPDLREDVETVKSSNNVDFNQIEDFLIMKISSAQDISRKHSVGSSSPNSGKEQVFIENLVPELKDEFIKGPKIEAVNLDVSYILRGEDLINSTNMCENLDDYESSEEDNISNEASDEGLSECGEMNVDQADYFISEDEMDFSQNHESSQYSAGNEDEDSQSLDGGVGFEYDEKVHVDAVSSVNADCAFDHFGHLEIQKFLNEERKVALIYNECENRIISSNEELANNSGSSLTKITNLNENIHQASPNQFSVDLNQEVTGNNIELNSDFQSTSLDSLTEHNKSEKINPEIKELQKKEIEENNMELLSNSQHDGNVTSAKLEIDELQPKVAFDLSKSQEEIMPNSLTHFTLFASTPFGKKQESTSTVQGAYSSLNLFGASQEDDGELMQFSSNFLPLQSEKNDNQNSKLNYSLETWDNFLGKSFDSSRSSNDNLFDSFISEPQSILFIEDDVNRKAEKERTVEHPLNKDEDNNATFIKNKSLELCNVNNITFTMDEKQDNTFVIDNTNCGSEQMHTDKKEGNWESGGGWFLHPQSSNDKLSGNIEPSPSTSKGSYVGFGMDDEIMAAIRNELIEKLPHAQGASYEKVKEEDELDQNEKNEVFLRYNVYNTPLSPIPEESFEETDDQVTTDEATPKLDDTDSDWSDHCDREGPPIFSSQTNESPIRGPNQRHTPSQDSCCSNDTLFNLEDFVCINEKESITLDKENSELLKDNTFTPDADEVLFLMKEENKNDIINNCENFNNEQSYVENIKQEVERCEHVNEAEVTSLSKDISDDTLQADHLNTASNSKIDISEINPTTMSDFLESERNHTSSVSLLPFVTQQVAPLPSPEDKPWKSLPASLLTYDKVTHSPLLPANVENMNINLKADDHILVNGKSEINLQHGMENSVSHLSEDVLKPTEMTHVDVSPHFIISSVVNESHTRDDNVVVNQPVYENSIVDNDNIDDQKHGQHTNMATSTITMNECDKKSPLYENIDSSSDIINEADYVNIVNRENVEKTKHNESCVDIKQGQDYVENYKQNDTLIIDNNGESEHNIFGVLTDIRFNGPLDSQLMSTSFSESNDVDEQDWDSGSDTRSSSSGEFIWKEGEHEESLKALRAAPHDMLEDIKPMEEITEESSESDLTSDDEGDTPEFVPSAWDKYATPTKSALRSPEKSLERPETKKSKGVWFKKQKYHCVYEYPREPESPVLQSQDLWKPQSDYSAFSGTSSNNDDDFVISSSSRPFDINPLCSQFFPGSSNWIENATPDSGLEDSTPGSISDASEFSGAYQLNIKQVLSLKKLAAEVIKKNKQEDLKGTKDVLGGLRHTRNKLKLDLPPSPSAFTSSRTFTVEPTPEPIVLREKPTFSTFGKSRFVVQQVNTPIENNLSQDKNVCFEVLPYKPKEFDKYSNDVIYERLKKSFDETSQFTNKKERFTKGEASLLDSADEDSGIESSTLERKVNNANNEQNLKID